MNTTQPGPDSIQLAKQNRAIFFQKAAATGPDGMPDMSMREVWQKDPADATGCLSRCMPLSPSATRHSIFMAWLLLTPPDNVIGHPAFPEHQRAGILGPAKAKQRPPEAIERLQFLARNEKPSPP